MDQTVSTLLDPHILTNNMAALRLVDAELADRIERAGRNLASVQPTRTRDGALNFHIPSDDGQATWFGRTSIPMVRAEALLEKFEAGLANVLLPGVGQGQEVTLLFQRLAPHRAVFIWEPQIASLALALRLHSWNDAISAGRCVLLDCSLEQLATSLTDWLDHHPGHLCPERIMMWPWSTPQELAACRAAVQSAYEEIERRRLTALAREKAEYAASAATPAVPSNPATAIESAFTAGPLPILALQPRDDFRDLAATLVTAAGSVGLTAAPFLITGPGDVHPLARLRALRRTSTIPTTAAILLDCSRQQLRDVLPDQTAAITWLGPAAQPLPALIKGIGPSDVLIAASPRVRDRILAAGWDRPPPPIVPYPCLVDPVSLGDAETDRSIDVLLVADAAPTDPEIYGYHLHTHAQLWRAACDLIKARIETFTEEQMASMLTRAEEKLGFHLDEENVRKAMLDKLGSTVANGLLGVHLAQVLAENKVRIAILGRGWAKTPFAGSVLPAHTVQDHRQSFARARLVVFSQVTGDGSWLPLLAAASGAVVVWRSHPFDTQPGGLATLLEPGKEMFCFQLARDLLTNVRQLLANTGKWRDTVRAALARSNTDHTSTLCMKTLQAAASSYLGLSAGQL